MATSRTGTATWKRIRALALHRATAEGNSRCPLCRQPFDWSRSLTPRSPEVDHIIPHSRGGEDHIDNTRVICRECNQRRGGADGSTRRARGRREVERTEPEASGIW